MKRLLLCLLVVSQLNPMETHQGKITVYTGPMACGKTEEMIKKIRLYQLEQKNMLICKHAFDTRSKRYLSSRAFPEIHIEAWPVADAIDLIRYANREHYDYLFFDEFQFASVEILNVIKLLKKRGMNIYVSGLDTDFKGDPFGIVMPSILSLANNVIKLRAICNVCRHHNATMTQRLLKGIPAQKTDPLIIIDDGSVTYEPRCADHHLISDD